MNRFCCLNAGTIAMSWGPMSFLYHRKTVSSETDYSINQLVSSLFKLTEKEPNAAASSSRSSPVKVILQYICNGDQNTYKYI